VATVVRERAPWWDRPEGDAARRRLPWRSTAAVAVLVMVGSTAAAELQRDERAPLDVFARVLLLGGALLLLGRWRWPVFVAFGTAATAMVYLGARDRARLVVLAYESGLVRPSWPG
jgi:hypothetical protein